MKSAQIVYENDRLLVVDKPSGWLSVPSRHEKSDTRKVLGRELEKDLKTRLYPVHRLDFEVSGLVVFAKDPEAHKKLNELFEKRQVQKTYEAWTESRSFDHWPSHLKKADEEMDLATGQVFTWQCKILRGKKRSYESPQGDPSLTKAVFTGVIAKHNFLSWEIEPLTGRPHQIRFELSRHGFPILGDALYGSKKSWDDDTIALRAVRLQWPAIFEGTPEKFVVKGLSL